MVVNAKNDQVVCLEFAKGSEHDFSLFKRSRLPINSNILARVDTGYAGIKDYHANTAIPKRSSKLHKLTPDEKANNKELSRLRVVNEIVTGHLKINRILSEKYRGRQKNFCLIFTLIAAIYNLKIMGF